MISPRSSVAPFARSARIILVRDAEAELLSTLSNAVAAGQTLAEVLSTLAPFFV